MTKTRAKTIKKVKPNKFVAVGLLLFFAVTGALYVLLSSAATTGTPAFGLYVNPASGTQAIGSQFEVKVYANLSTNDVQSVATYIKYDPAKLQLVSANQSGIDPNYTINSRCTNIDGCKPAGEIVFVIGYSGTGAITHADGLLVGNLTFKALSAGTANVTFDSDTKLSGFSSPTIPQATLDSRTLLNGSYTIPAPAGGGTGTGTGTGTGGGSNTANPNTTGNTGNTGSGGGTAKKPGTGSGTGTGTTTTTTPGTTPTDQPPTEQPTTTATTTTPTKTNTSSEEKETGDVKGSKVFSTPTLLVASATLAAVIVGTTMLAFSTPVRGAVMGMTHAFHHTRPLPSGHIVSEPMPPVGQTPTTPVNVTSPISHVDPPKTTNTTPSNAGIPGNVISPKDPPTPSGD